MRKIQVLFSDTTPNLETRTVQRALVEAEHKGWQLDVSYLQNTRHLPGNFRVFPWRGYADFMTLWQIRKHFRQCQANVIQAVGPQAMITLALLQPGQFLALGWQDTPQWFLNKAKALLSLTPPSPSVNAQKIIPCRVAESFPAALPLATASRGIRILCASEHHRPDALKTAIWAFDVLKYLDPRWELHLYGPREHRAELLAFAKAISPEDQRVIWGGSFPDAFASVPDVSIVWITDAISAWSIAPIAQHYGIPALAFDQPEFSQLPSVERVPNEDRVRLAIRTRDILQGTQPFRPDRVSESHQETLVNVWEMS